jgi:hypothetical protein
MTKKSPKKKTGRGKFSAADWRDIYDALMDVVSWHHLGLRADRIVALAQKIRKERMP